MMRTGPVRAGGPLALDYPPEYKATMPKKG